VQHVRAGKGDTIIAKGTDSSGESRAQSKGESTNKAMESQNLRRGSVTRDLGICKEENEHLVGRNIRFEGKNCSSSHNHCQQVGKT